MSRLLIVRDSMDGGTWYYDLGLDEWTPDVRRASEFLDHQQVRRVVRERGLGSTATAQETK